MTEAPQQITEDAPDPMDPLDGETDATHTPNLTAPGSGCSRVHCFAPDTGCLDGSLEFADCHHWEAIDTAAANESAGERPPWSGHALGAVDLEVVTAPSRGRLVAIVGAPKAGKTTALATYFIRLRRGYRPSGYTFAGSYTLLGWAAVARHLGFPPAGSRSFPPYTTSAGERSPALLHVRLAKEGGPVSDLFLTDVPGEWFEEWAFDATSVNGAGWIADRADLFVVLSDSEALVGEDRGVARTNYIALASRVASETRGRPVIPIRAKADVEIPPEVDEDLARHDRRLFGSAARKLSVVSGGESPLLEPLDELTRVALAPQRIKLPAASSTGNPFLDYRSAELATR